VAITTIMNVCVLTVAYDSGHYRARMGRGPAYIFEAGLKPLLTRLGHNFKREEITVPDSHLAEIKTAFGLCRAVAERVRANRSDGYFPLVLSGNCNTAVGAISGCGCQNTGVVWFDAHGEATTPDTTSSGFLDGMGISILTGQCWSKMALTIPGFYPVPAEQILLVGSRDLENDEIALLNRIGVTRVAGIEDLGSQLTSLAHQVDEVYMHFDLDVLDPSEAIANQWTPTGGMSIEALKHAVKSIRRTTRVKGFGIASYDPELDRDGRALGAASSVAELLLGADTFKE
jgi:arginase